MGMEDHRLKAFCLIIETGSFSRAAEAKFMTQSAMSHLIKNLENELGVKLLHRHGKITVPTPAGRLFYSHSRQILDHYKKMENDVYTLARKVKGTLYLGASTTAATYLLPQVFYAFYKNNPEVGIELSVANTEQVIERLFESKIDMGIVEGNIKDTKFFSEEIAKDEIVIIAADNNPLTKAIKKLTPDDLLSQPFIMPETGSGIREFMDDYMQALKLDSKKIRVAMVLGNTELIIQMVQSGIGISFVSKWSAFNAIKDGSVRTLHVSDKTLKRKFYMVSLEKEPSSSVISAFRDFIRGYRFFSPL